VRVSWVRLAIVAVSLAGAFAVAHLLLQGRLLAPWQGQAAFAPLYAFVQPVLRPQAILFALLAAALAFAAPILADPLRTSRRSFAMLLLAASVLLPLALHFVRSRFAELGSQFDLYRNEEFLHDARRIADLEGFLDRYVELMPTLSLHGQHFPPGHAVLLHLAARFPLPDTLAAGLVALAAAAGGVWLAWKAFEELAEEQAARQGALLLLAAPALLDFACTSMDAVFLFFATLAWFLALRALRRGGAARAWLAGAALGLAACFSFSALPLALAIVLLAILRDRSAWRRTAPFLLHGLAGAAAFTLLLFAATGFPIWSCFLEARRSNAALMEHALRVDASSAWASLSIGNAAAFLAGAGLGLAAASIAGARQLKSPVALASILALLAMSFGGVYFLETERIWLFALPWLAACAVSGGSFDDRSMRLSIGVGFAQALLAETVLFTLW
jgi:hypothetical protein